MTESTARRLTHLDEHGSAHMVDVGAKPVTARRAIAKSVVRMSRETALLVEAGDAPKGDVCGVARIAAIQAVKRADELIPLAHPLPLDHIAVDIAIDVGLGTATITCEVGTSARTGVEMEAMTGCAMGALTIYDMVKGVERGVRIEDISLVSKTGGRNGDWHVDAEPTTTEAPA